MDILKIIGKNTKYYRQMARLSQERLAELCGLHRTYVGAVERGERNISALNIAKIAIALEIEPYTLLKESSDDS
jgi:transcriptional regulator with XRE-family HTH domain